MSKLRKIDYKWVIVVISCLMVFTVLGFCSSANSMYISPITEALGISRASYSVTTSVRYVTTAVANLFFGMLIYRLGAKKLILGGFVSLIISTLLYSVSESVLVFCIGSVFLGIGLSFTTTSMVGAVVNKWCSKNKGTIMGIALASNGIGAALARTVLTPVINSGDPFGYRNAYRLVIVILAGVMLVMLLLFRDDPKGAEKTKIEIKRKSDTAEGAVISRTHLVASLACVFLTGLVLQSVTGISDPHLKDNNVDLLLITTVLSIHSLALSGAKFLTGFIYDRAGIRIASGICYGSSLIALVSLLFVGSGPFGTVCSFAYSVFAAIALPLDTIMLPIFARELFGEGSFNKALGIFVSVNTAGYALGGPIANLVFDKTGSYDIWIIVSITLIFTVTLVMNLILTSAKRRRAKLESEAPATV